MVTRNAPKDTETLIHEVESLMHRIARGGRVDRTGQMALEQLSSGGKRFRVRLALAAAEALGASASDSTVWAAAMELLHNATLIHDDVQDEDTSRRGRPTLWVRHGIAQAINAGDFMLMLPFIALGKLQSDKGGLLSALTAEYATRIVRGQVEELGLLPTRRLDVQSYLNACEGKTGALIALPVIGAALLADRSEEEAQALARPFLDLGLLFQIQDDVVDLYGDKGRSEVGCDIYEGKVSALVVEQVHREPHSERVVLEILEQCRQETSAEDVAFMQELFIESGALDGVLSRLLSLRASILGSEALTREPALHKVTEKLVAMALAPVEHLGIFSLPASAEREVQEA